jgi:beta-glucosidase
MIDVRNGHGRDAYTQYADACFTAFGDRVKHWITFNEPQQFSVLGYGNGIHAPGRCSDRTTCPAGDTATEPYRVGHNVLLAHATAVDLYKRKFKPTQGGLVGMAVDCEWGEPMTDSVADKEAAERHVLFQLGW